MNDRNLFLKINVDGTTNLIKCCKEANVQKLVLTSSCSVIYNGADIRNGKETNPFPKKYLDCYTETKMMQECLVVTANDSNLATVSIRPHGIFGPNDHTITEIVSKGRDGKLKMMIGSGENIVDFTYVRNVCHGLILAGEQLNVGSRISGQVYNITNDEPIHFWVFISVLLTKMNISPPKGNIPYWFLYAIAWLLMFISFLISPIYQWSPFLTPFKVALSGTHHYYSCEKAKAELGYVPLVNLKDAIDITISDLQERVNKKKD